MAPRTITYPPGRVKKHHQVSCPPDPPPVDCCMNYDDTLTVNFDDPGYFKIDPDDAFQEHHKGGHKSKHDKSVKDIHPNANYTSATLTFEDDDTNCTYVYNITFYNGGCPNPCND